MEKLHLKINRERLLEEWRNNGQLQDLFQTYLNEPEYVTQEINSKGAFTINFLDVCSNMEQIPLSCFTEESQDKLMEFEDALGFNGEYVFWYNGNKDELLINENRENLMIVTEIE
ncbi:MAG: hypothetical protein ACOCV1_06340 [Bacillota bacterium]